MSRRDAKQIDSSDRKGVTIGAITPARRLESKDIQALLSKKRCAVGKRMIKYYNLYIQESGGETICEASLTDRIAA